MRTALRVDHPAAEIGARRESRVLLVPWMVAGVQTQYEQMRRTPSLARSPVVEVHPYREGAMLERLPLPTTLRATIRSTLTASRSLSMREIDAVWSQVALPMLPFVLTRGLGRVRVYYAGDCTPIQLHRFGSFYQGVDDPASPQGRLTRACLRLFWGRCAGLLPWSTWAARSMIADYGVPPENVHVVPPGIDLDEWSPVAREPSERVRLLFVGADFERKGGPLLLDVFRRHLRDDCELHLVTRSHLEPEPGIYVYSNLRIGDGRLRELYQTSDVLVIPTLADCFSMAALEAMACGLPVIITAVGGIPEIVVDGETGLLIRVGDGDSLLHALRTIVASPSEAQQMGRAGRRRAAELFDGRAQSSRTLEVLSEVPAGRG